MRYRPDPRTDQHSFAEAMVRLGMLAVRIVTAVLGAVWFLVSGVLRMLWYILRQGGRLLAFLGRSAAHALAEHNRPSRVLLGDVRRARQESFGKRLGKVLRLLGSWIFGEHGILRTGFNYVLPVASIAFLAAVIRYGTGLDYAVHVTCNGEEIGLVTDESEFEAAEKEVMQRISGTGEEIEMHFQPVYTLQIVSENDRFVTSHTIADKLLASSGAELSDAYGVYVDGTFIGAVQDKNAVSDAMDNRLAQYAATLGSQVQEVYYTKDVTYEQGTYLTASLTSEEDIIAALTEEKTVLRSHTVAQDETPMLIAAEYHMTTEELEALNPALRHFFYEGMTLQVSMTSRFIPIGYTRSMTVTSYIGYPTVRIETSALNLGKESLLSKGAVGERTSDLLITYVDGVEESRTVLRTAITKEPVPEQIGVGTYSPEPASASTVLLGSGQFGWPVNGGYISSPFGGTRNHKGLDIAAPYGTEIYAAQGGTVVRAGWNSGGYGNYVIIEHDNGYQTLYGHASLVVAYAGQTVEKGQLIAYVGSTGDSTGNHCHFEVRLNNICMNPADFLRVNAD